MKSKKNYPEKIHHQNGQKPFSTNLKIPKDQDPIEYIIGHVAKYLSKNFTFGYYTREDITNEIWLIALKVIESDKYNSDTPLENFLIIHVKSRLINLRRNKYARKTLKENRRKDLMNPSPDVDISEPYTYSPHELESTELEELIDNNLPSAMRQDYLRMLDGCIVPEHRKQKVRDFIKSLLEEYSYESD